MRIHRLEREQSLPHPVEDVFAFFADARNLERLTPPLLRFEVLTPGPIEMRPGALIEYRLRLHGVGVDWLTRIEEWEPGVRFVDMQLAGPYRLWHHTHTFEPDGADATIMRDVVRYAIGFGALGELADRLLVRRDLEAIFDHRAERVPALLAQRRSGGS